MSDAYTHCNAIYLEMFSNKTNKKLQNWPYIIHKVTQTLNAKLWSWLKNILNI